MKPRRTPTSNFVFRLEGGTEDNDLWCRLDNEEGTVNSVWVPTDEERQAIAEGANVELSIWGGQPPVALRTTDEQPGRSS